MSAREEKDQELLRLTITELQRLHDSMTSSFDNLRTKALALLAGEVAIITFLFSGNSSHPFFRGAVAAYGIVFYGIAILLLAMAFLTFIYVISTVTWHHPPEEKDVSNVTDRFNHQPIKFLTYLRDEYIGSINHCGGIINVKATRFMWGVYALSLGIFIILMLKYGGGIIKI